MAELSLQQGIVTSILSASGGAFYGGTTGEKLQ